jgi:hypothetical protein
MGRPAVTGGIPTSGEIAAGGLSAVAGPPPVARGPPISTSAGRCGRPGLPSGGNTFAKPDGDLAQVIEHMGPLPHPTRDRPQ